LNTATDAQNVGTQPNRFNLPEAWRLPLSLFAAGLACILFLFSGPIEDAVFLWSNRSAYNHCYLIIPISLFLLWENRGQLSESVPTPSLLGLVGIAGFSAVWIFAAAAGIAEGEHIAIVGLIQSLIIALFGTRIYRQNLIAFLYLWLLVPTGTFLLPTLQQIALVQTEFLLNLSGIPNFVEGFIVEVPTGRYHIAPGCAGLNFVLSSIALTPLYGYLIYQSWQKRLAAVGIMLLVALVANAIRIFAIIALAEWSNKQIDIVDDHLLYGWGFFAVILLLMGWMGLKFEDPPQKHIQGQTSAPSPIDSRKLIVSGLVAIALMWPAPLYYQNSQRDVNVDEVMIDWPQSSDNWSQIDDIDDWQANFPTAHGFSKAQYSNGETNLNVNVAYYWRQIEGRELINKINAPAGADPWLAQSRKMRSVTLDGADATVIQQISLREPEVRLVWHWYWIDGAFVSRTTEAKLRQAKVSLVGGETRAAAIMVSAPITTTIESAAAEMSAFVESNFPIREILSSASAVDQ